MQREQPDDQDAAAWQDIVDNYGERITLDPDEGDDPDEPDDTAPVATVEVAEPDDDPDEETDRGVDRFVPPAPPPVPIAPPDRFVAWLGVLGAPAAFLVLLVLGIDTPALVDWLLIGGFLAGFGYLVFRLPKSPEDPWDDGARI